MLLRRSIAVFGIIVGLILCFLAVIWGTGIDHTLNNARAIETRFQRAEAEIETFERDKGRQPDAQEFDALTNGQPHGRYSVQLLHDGFDQCDGELFDSAAADAPPYLLATWRGEWLECYSPTTSKTTLVSNREAFFLTGHQSSDQAALVFLALASFASAMWFWKPMQRQSN